MKKIKDFLKITIWIIVFIFLFINFYQYLFVFEVDQKYKSKLFKECSKSIDTTGFPKTVAEWRKVADKREIALMKKYSVKEWKIKPRYLYDTFKNGSDESKKKMELITAMGDDINQKKSFVGSLFRPTSHIDGYYDYKGDLLLIEEKVSVAWQGYCRYNTKGQLLEASYSYNELYYTFTPQKHLMHRCYYGSCDRDLIKYKKHI